MKRDKEIYDGYFECRKRLVSAKLNELKEYDDEFQSIYGNYRYYTEIASINLDFGRQTGSTYFIHYIADKYKYTDKSILIVFYTTEILRRFVKEFDSRIHHCHRPTNSLTRGFDPGNIGVCLVNEFENQSIFGDKYDMVLFDTAALYKPRQVIKNKLKHEKDFKTNLFIYL